MYADYHVHSNTSIDSSVEIEEYCKRAIELGMDEICFTNHQEWLDIDSGFSRYILTEKAIRDYRRKVEEMRKKYPSLKLRFGVEMGYFEGYDKQMADFVEKNDFDFVMLSYHDCEDVCFADSSFIHDFSKDEIIDFYKGYFLMLKRLLQYRFFDCFAHIDVIRRALPEADFNDYKEFVIDFADEMKKYDIAFEVNTSGWRNKVGEPHPNEDFLKILYERGIRKVTIGSDCHLVKDLGSHNKEARELLKKVGFKQFCTFEKRKAIYHEL